MAQGIKVKIDGVTYSSITTACKVLGVTKSVLYKTAGKLKMTPLEMVEYYIEHRQLPTQEKQYISVRGEDFTSIQNLCTHFGLVASTANELRNRKGWTWEQTITYYEQKRDGNIPPVGQVTVKGVNFPNIQDACEYFGYSYQAVKNLAYYDYLAMKEALEQYIDGEYPLFPKCATVGAIKYPTPKSALEPVSLYNTWSLRLISEQGMTCEEVINHRLTRVITKFWGEEVENFATKEITWQTIQEQMVLTGLDPKKLWIYYTEHNSFPPTTGESYYIQFHTFPSIELACLHFNLDIAEVTALHGKYSWNGAFTHLLK